jgi:Leucine-rich repeat (LRR) protein
LKNALQGSNDLQELILYETTKIVDLEFIKYCKNLEKLIVYIRWDFYIPPTLKVSLSECKRLRHIDLTDTKILDISMLQYCENLEKLGLANTLVSNISALENCQKLVGLDLRNTRISGMPVLKNCLNFKYLSLSMLHISDISPLENYINLEILDLSYNDFVDISVLSIHKKLKALSLLDNPNITNISALVKCKSLNILVIDSECVPDQQNHLKSSVPNVEITPYQGYFNDFVEKMILIHRDY